MKYKDFLKGKIVKQSNTGFEVDIDDINPVLFDWQRVVVRWSLYKGRSAIFEGCGLGKTFQQLECARLVNEHTIKDILILAPLAVSKQTMKEGLKLGINVNVCREESDFKTGINITNYERIDKFDCSRFVGVVLDESGILKGFTGKTKVKLMKIFKETPYKLCCTATPSPNDHMELLNHADFLNVMPASEALSRWFINDTMNMGKYRLKKHAVNDFWRWVSTWAVCVNKPSDIGFDDNGFILPALKTHKHIISENELEVKQGQLFYVPETINASSLYRELRETADARCKYTADIVNKSDKMWICWCNTNKESALLKKYIRGAVEVFGSMPASKKEILLEEFTEGKHRVMITKPSLAGFGLNWQHINHVAFVGLSFSFEQHYQAIRRSWRFGQELPVHEHIILSPSEDNVYRIVQGKEEKHNEMTSNMVKNINNYLLLKKDRLNLVEKYIPETIEGENWKIIIGDSVSEIKQIPDESVDFQIFSPPFSSLYIYSDLLMDMGNCKNDEEFFKHFRFLIPELKRILTPGRLCAVHCKQLVNYKNNTGMSGLRDFRGEIIRAFLDYGWSYHSEITIWKDPVIEMQRTKAHGLLHRQMKKDASVSRQGLPDYLVIFRKWPDNLETSGPKPVSKPGGLKHYVGEDIIPEPIDDGYHSIHVWQKYASPVWFDIKQTNVLNCKLAREGEDEKHICPLQLDIVERAIHLWTNSGDTVFTPFCGIGSEIYSAVKMGRKGMGIELKRKYAMQAADFMKSLEVKNKQFELFKMEEVA